MSKTETKYIIDQIIKQKEYKKNNGPIEMTADQLWKYSGKVEPTSPEVIRYEQEIKSWVNKMKNY
tara:strand:- start:141 stop:335 length:195 start_codon:yes stop_codon:yes gene_type:complete